MRSDYLLNHKARAPNHTLLDLENSLAIQNLLWQRAVTYNRPADGNPEVGLIAEEVAKVVPQVVSYHEGAADGLDYGRLTAVLVEAIKEQQKEIEQLKARLDSLEPER